jgi:predicted metal-dependent hydrolase
MFEVLETAAGPCRLYRTKRRSLAISVLPDGMVELTAPLEAPIAVIRDRVAKRMPWIRRQQRVFQEMNATRGNRRYCSGTTHRYLGRQYRLKVDVGPRSEVKLIGGYFRVITQTGSEQEVEKALSRWFRDRAREQLEKRLDGWRVWCQERHLAEPRLRMASMQKRWASAHKDGRISFNPELIHAPSICVDYVVAHEICHLKQPHHGPAFYQLLESVFPSWRNAKQRLEQADL